MMKNPINETEQGFLIELFKQTNGDSGAQVSMYDIGEALNMTGGNRSQAAKLLGMSRPTLHSKIDKYGLKLETSVKEDR